MKKILFSLVCLVFLSTIIKAQTIDLSKSKWEFRKASDASWLPATVPGTVHTDLLANKKIENAIK